MQFCVERRLTNPFGIINIIKISCFLLQAMVSPPPNTHWPQQRFPTIPLCHYDHLPPLHSATLKSIERPLKTQTKRNMKHESWQRLRLNGGKQREGERGRGVQAVAAQLSVSHGSACELSLLTRSLPSSAPWSRFRVFLHGIFKAV